MIIIMKPQATEEQIGSLCQDLIRQGMQVQRNAGVDCTVLGVLIEKAAYKPLRQSPRISLLITAIGVSYFLENVAQLIFGANAHVIPTFIDDTPIQLGQIAIPTTALITVVVAGISMVALNVLVKKTRMGKAMRAVSEAAGAAQLMGININRTISLTFAIGSGLAAIAGALLCSAYPTLQNTTGAMPGIKAFVAAVFGGIGSIPGAVVGAFLIGICESIIKGSDWSVFSDAFTFAILIVVLCVKPTGLFGEKVTDKV